jgi:hypothetical protein
VVRDGTATPTKYATTYGYDQFGDKTSRSGLLRNGFDSWVLKGVRHAEDVLGASLLNIPPAGSAPR